LVRWLYASVLQKLEAQQPDYRRPGGGRTGWLLAYPAPSLSQCMGTI
jgi:hypothetical protein